MKLPIINGQKFCSHCQQIKPIEEFYRHKKGNLFGRCKACNQLYAKAWRKKNLERHRAATRARHKLNPEKAKNTWLKKHYGITLAEYNKMLSAQWGGCAICGKTVVSKGQGGFHVDHCHEVRAILCSNCNLGIGNMQNSIEVMENAIRYLKKHGAQPTTGRVLAYRWKRRLKKTA